MSNDPHAATGPRAASPKDRAEPDELEEGYRAAEWSYNPEAYELLDEAAAYYQTDPSADHEANGNGVHLREGGVSESSAEDWADPQSPAAKMAPRPNLRMFGRRPDEGPKDTESKILAVSAQLQELLAQRKEEAETGMLPAAGASTKRTGFKPAGNAQTGSRLPIAPPISLPMRAHRAPRNSGFPGLGRASSNWKRPLLYTALAVAVIGGSFLAGRVGQTPGRVPTGGKGPATFPVPTAESAAWSDANIKILDQALAADKAGDLDGASRILGTVEAKGKTSLGFRGYQANLLSRSGFGVDAEGALAGTPDLSTPDGVEQMGFVYARDRDFDKAIEWLQRAVNSNPFPAENFYRLAEALRRKGNFADTVTRLEEALIRVPTEAEFSELRDMVSFKLRLAKIEGGRRGEVTSELEAQLKGPAPSGYWILTAAAASLEDRDLKTAATWLTKARASLGEDRFNALLNDYFFRAYADHAEVSSFFAVSDAVRKRKEHMRSTFFVDP